MIAVSKLDSTRPLKPGEVPTTRITAAEYAEAFGVDLNTAYDQLKSASKQLYKRSITFFEPAWKRNGKPLPPTIVHMRWVGQVKYQDGEGWVELSWWPALLPHLTGLRRQFTSYQLQQASALRSVYSWKLLELLTRFESTGWAEYTIEDFAASMDATEKQRENFANIRRKIIEPAVKELTEKDGWLIQWEPIKAGRKVKAVRFTFMRDPQLRLSV
jgi:plasmid replication initiation protein